MPQPFFNNAAQVLLFKFLFASSIKNEIFSVDKPVKICNNCEYSVKFKCSTVVVNILKTPVQRPPERSFVQSPSVQSPGVQMFRVRASRIQMSRCSESKRPESSFSGMPYYNAL